MGDYQYPRRGEAPKAVEPKPGDLRIVEVTYRSANGGQFKRYAVEVLARTWFGFGPPVWRLRTEGDYSINSEFGSREAAELYLAKIGPVAQLKRVQVWP